MAASSSAALPVIPESKASGNSSLEETSTPKLVDNTKIDDPWLIQEPAPSNFKPSKATSFDYGALIWHCLREGEDPWVTD